MQGSYGRAGVDAEVFGQVRLQPPVGVEGIGLTLGDVVGRDQLGPKPFPERMFGAQHLQARDDGISTSAGDLGFGVGGLHRHPDLGQRRGKRVDESEFAKVVEEGPAPFGKGGCQVAARVLEPPRGSGVHTRVLLGDEAPEIAIGVRDVELIPRRNTRQHPVRIAGPAAEQSTQVGHVGMNAGPCCRHRRLAPDRIDQRVDRHRAVAIHHQHGQHCSLLGRPQRHQGAAGPQLQRSQHSELETCVRTSRDSLSVDVGVSSHCDLVLRRATLPDVEPGTSIRQRSDDSARVTGRQHPRRYISGHDAASPDHRVVADAHARTHDHSGGQPYVVTDDDRRRGLPARAPGLIVVDGMKSRNQLRAWADRHVVADRDRRAVEKDRVVVDEAVGADGDLGAVVALESRKDLRSLRPAIRATDATPVGFARRLAGLR